MAINLTQVLTLPSYPAELGISYSPDFLPNASFRVSVTSHPDFQKACFQGFEMYFEALIGVDKDGEDVFTKPGYTWDEIVTFLVDNISIVNDGRFVLDISLAWTAGFTLGFLSALALYSPEDAQRGLAVLSVLLGPGAVASPC
jgi:hypothetical protein